MKSIDTQVDELHATNPSEVRLTPWERQFLITVKIKQERGECTTPAQNGVISRLWDNVFIHGKRKVHRE